MLKSWENIRINYKDHGIQLFDEMRKKKKHLTKGKVYFALTNGVKEPILSLFLFIKER